MAVSENNAIHSYRFRVHCLSTTKKLKDKRYVTVKQIEQDAFALYDQAQFTDHNAIIIYLNDENQQLLLTSLPTPLPKRQYRDLFIKFVCISSHCSIDINVF